MQPRRTERGIDLRPWAAYVVGHHPLTLATWHKLQWTELRQYDDPGRGPWDRIPRELEELASALGILADRHRVDATTLNRFRVQMERFTQIHNDILSTIVHLFFASRFVDWKEAEEPGSGALRDMAELAESLIGK